MFYVGIMERGGDGIYIHFPNVPGCGVAGKDMQEAAANAEGVLRSHLMLSLEQGESLPPASKLDDIAPDPDVTKAGRILVRFEPPDKSVRLNITMPEDLLSQADRYASANGYSRSGLLARALRELLGAD